MRHRVTVVLREAGLRGLAVTAALIAADGCSNVLGIDGEYGSQPKVDGGSVTPPPRDASPDVRDSSTPRDSTVVDRSEVRDVVEIETAPPPCQTPTGACANALPSGWELVLFETSRNAACPAGFTSEDAVADPVAATGACDCSCMVDSSSTCTMGTMLTKHGTTNQCLNNGLTINVPGPGCVVLSSSFSTWFSGTAVPARVTCTAAPVTNAGQVTSSELRSCQIPSQCLEEVCNGDVPIGFSACVTRDGDTACPAGWGTKTLIGDSASLSCSACTCTATGTCTGARANFFTDNACMTALVSLDVNDVCQATPGAVRIGSYNYTAALTNPMCTATGMKTATVGLMAPRTMCCKSSAGG
jgi:hypothetical protein